MKGWSARALGVPGRRRRFAARRWRLPRSSARIRRRPPPSLRPTTTPPRPSPSFRRWTGSCSRRSSNARKLIEEGKYADAVRYLGAVLDAPQDFFDYASEAAKTSHVYRSIKAEAQALLGQMPAQGRELYELQYGARARQMLDAAIASGDAAGLAEVSGRLLPHPGRLRGNPVAGARPTRPRQPAGRRADARAAPRRMSGGRRVRAGALSC